MKRKLYYITDGWDPYTGSGEMYNASTSVSDVIASLEHLMQYFKNIEGYKVEKTPHKNQYSVVFKKTSSRWFWIEELDFEDPVVYGM